MQPSEQPEHPIDYLDSIATTPKGSTKKVNDKLFFGVLIAGLVVTLLVGAFAFLGTGSNSKDDISRLSVRLKNLRSLNDSSRKNIVSSELRSTNASLSLVFTSANHDLAEHLTRNNIEPAKVSPKITTEENTEELIKQLEEARLNALFDRAYAREMSYQIETLIALLRQTEGKTKNAAEKEFLTTTANNFAPLQKQLANFGAATK